MSKCFRVTKKISNMEFLFEQHSFPRKFCVIGDRYMAMVPKLTRHNDIICDLFSAHILVVLRVMPESVHGGPEKRYQIVWKCYVHGMINGQAFDREQEDQYFKNV